MCLRNFLVASAVAAGSVAGFAQVTGSGSPNAVPKFTGSSSPSSAVTGSAISEVNGNVGIGTTAPLSALTLAGSNTSNPNSGPQVDYSGESLTFENTNGLRAIGGIKMVQPTGYYADAGDMVFSTSYGGLSEKMRISASGMVGIGTTSPGDQLQVNGTTWGNPGLLRFGDGNGYSPYIKTFKWTGGGNSYYQTTIGNSLTTNGGLEFQTGTGGAAIGSDTQITRMALLPSGAVVLGSGGFITFPDGSTQSTAYSANQAAIGSMFSSSNGNLAIGGANPINNLSLALVGGQANGLAISASTGAWTKMLVGSAASAYNPLVQAGDTSTIYSAGPSETGGFVLGPWSSSYRGLRMDNNGNVGIGTGYPAAKLDVSGNVKISGSGASMSFPDGTVQSTAWNGTTCGGDYAESVDVTGDRKAYEPGDVLVVDPKVEGKFLKSSEPYATTVMGIYSTQPGLTGRRVGAPKTGEEVPMAMLGIVPTKVSAENGAIKPGDLLVTSSTPGYAMKATDRSRMVGALIGKALGHLDSGIGVIEVGIALQ